MATSSSRYKQEASPTCHPRIHDATHTETRRAGRIRIRANLGSTSGNTTRRKQRKEHLSMHVVLRWCTGLSLPVREARFKRVPLASSATHDFVACQRERNLPNLHSWKRRRPPPQYHCGRSHASISRKTALWCACGSKVSKVVKNHFVRQSGVSRNRPQNKRAAQKTFSVCTYIPACIVHLL